MLAPLRPNMQRVVRGRYFLILRYKTDVVCSCFVLFLSMIVLFFSLPFVVVVCSASFLKCCLLLFWGWCGGEGVISIVVYREG